MVEILSPTNKTETWTNVWAYTTIPTVKEILILHSVRIRAELLRRDDQNQWPERPLVNRGRCPGAGQHRLQCPIAVGLSRHSPDTKCALNYAGHGRYFSGVFLGGIAVMEIDTDKIDEAVLALLYLTLHGGFRAWKGHDWDAMDRLHRKGMIENPVGKAKSVVLTDEGLKESERLFRKLFERSAA